MQGGTGGVWAWSCHECGKSPICMCVRIYITLYIYKSTPLYSHFASDHLFLSGPTYQSSIKWQTQTSKNGLRVGYREGGALVFRHIERLDLPEMLKSKFQKCFKRVSSWRSQKDILRFFITISSFFSPIQVYKSFLKIYIFEYFTKKA